MYPYQQSKEVDEEANFEAIKEYINWGVGSDPKYAGIVTYKTKHRLGLRVMVNHSSYNPALQTKPFDLNMNRSARVQDSYVFY